MEDLQLAGQVEANPDGEAAAPDTSQENETTQDGVQNAEGQDASNGDTQDKTDEGESVNTRDADEGESKGESPRARKRRLAREREEQLKKENAELQERLSYLEETQSKLKKPNPDDYDNDADFMAENSAYAAQRSITDGERQRIAWEQQRKAAEREKLRQEAIQDVEERASQRYSDFGDKLRAAQPVMATASPALRSALSEVLTTDEGADVAYFLSTHPHEILAFNGLSDVQAAIQLGKLAAGLPKASPKKITSAKAPLNTVKPTGAIAANPEKMSYSEYAAWRRAGNS